MVELLEKVCPLCGVVYGLERTYYEHRKSGQAAKENRNWHCPNGHSLVMVTTDADKLREQLDEERRQRQRAEQRIAEWQDEARLEREKAEKERRRANGYKGHATRITKRAKAGVCPCCNRTFKQLAAHMANKHPEFTPLALEEGISLQ